MTTGNLKCGRSARDTAANRGFSLIELLITLVVIGIIMAITIPMLVNALDKGRQKRTMADLRLLGGSIEAYSVDYSIYPSGTVVGALSILVPEYTRDLVTVDAWSHELVYTGSPLGYTIGSTAKNGGNSLTLIGGGGPTKRFDDDIVYTMGRFIQWPEGMQER